MVSSSSSSLETITQILTYYGYSFMLIFGTIGNILNIVLFLRKKLRTTSCNNYFLTSAFSNLIALNVTVIFILYTKAQPWNLTIPYCKIETYIMNVSLQMSRYLIPIACFDRYALCSTSAYLRRFCNARIARQYVIPSIILISFIIPLHIPVYVTIVNSLCEFTGIPELYNTIYGILIIGIISPGLMFIFSLLIFRNLKLRQRRRQIRPFIVGNRIPSLNENRRTPIKDEQVLAMLLIQVLAYVVSSTPYTITRLYLVLKVKNNGDVSSENEPNTAFILFITDMLRLVCPFTSFYLLILVSQLYRREMKLIILSIYHWCGPLCDRNINHHPNINLTRNSNRIRQNQMIPM